MLELLLYGVIIALLAGVLFTVYAHYNQTTDNLFMEFFASSLAVFAVWAVFVSICWALDAIARALTGAA